MNYSTWQFKVIEVGEDLQIVPLSGIGTVRATCFGGGSDSMDSGETASGLSTKRFPWLPAVSLPMNTPSVGALADSPVPKMPFGMIVELTAIINARLITRFFPSIELGPGRRTGNAVDLTVAAARHFDPRATANDFGMNCKVRIIGGAKYL